MTPQLAFDPYMLQQASCRASALVARSRFSWDDWPDLRQELVLDCLQRAPRFNPERGDWQAFVRGVMRNQSIALAVRESRRLQCEPLSAGDIPQDLDDEAPSAAFEPATDDPSDSLALTADVRRVVDSLPENLRSLACDLMGMTVAEAAAKRGKSTQWIYQLVGKLRKAFLQAGVTPTRVRNGGTR